MQEGGGPDHPRASEASGDHMSDDAKSTGGPIHSRRARVRTSMLVLLPEHDFVEGASRHNCPDDYVAESPRFSFDEDTFLSGRGA